MVAMPSYTVKKSTTSKRFSTTETPLGASKKAQRDDDNEDSSVKAADNPTPPSSLPPSPTKEEEEELASLDPTIREKLRARYDAKREELRCRAEDARDSARTHMQEFREHPGQSARDGAKTMGGMIRKYGPVFVGTYATVYFSTLALLFAGVESGVLDPIVLFSWLGQGGGAEGAGAESTVQLVVDFMESHSFTQPYAHVIEKNPSVANLAVAWIAVKFTEPIRLGVSLTATPRVARYLGYNAKPDGEEEEEAPANEPNTTEDSATTTTTSSRIHSSSAAAAATGEKAESSTGSKP